MTGKYWLPSRMIVRVRRHRATSTTARSLTSATTIVAILIFLLQVCISNVTAFTSLHHRDPYRFVLKNGIHRLYMIDSEPEKKKILLSDETEPEVKDQQEPNNLQQAEIGTINERLKEELRQAAEKEKYGARSNLGKKLGLSSLRRSTGKTDAEREAALEEMRNLNGVNPASALGGSFLAIGIAVGLWYATNVLATFFALHPVNSDVYFVQRVAAVFRNVVVGLISLASGFFGVTGFGIFLLGVRVAYGVATGELDPTPMKKNQEASPELPNVWDLMMNKKPSQRRKKGKNDNNPFGI